MYRADEDLLGIATSTADYPGRFATITFSWNLALVWSDLGSRNFLSGWFFRWGEDVIICICSVQ